MGSTILSTHLYLLLGVVFVHHGQARFGCSLHHGYAVSGVSAQCDCDMEIEDAASSTDNLLLDVQADLLDQMGELFDWISELKHTLHRHPPRLRPGYGYKKPFYGYKPAPYGYKKPAYSRW